MHAEIMFKLDNHMLGNLLSQCVNEIAIQKIHKINHTDTFLTIYSKVLELKCFYLFDPSSSINDVNDILYYLKGICVLAADSRCSFHFLEPLEAFMHEFDFTISGTSSIYSFEM
jgi:hypothetical protein